MTKPNLLVVCPPNHYVLRNLTAINDLANVFIGNDAPVLRQHAPEAEVILYSGLTGGAVDFTDVWRHAKKVKWIHCLSAGVEKLLFPELVASPVPITNAKGVFKRSLAEFAVLGMLYSYKRVRRLIENQRAHRWDDFKVEWLLGKVMGVIGYGEIGQECARFAKALGMKVYALRRKPQLSMSDPLVDRIFGPDQLHEMLEQTDVVLAAAPLTPETRHMLSNAEFEAMKASALVINVGRGPVIDETALILALQQRRIAGAALDVFEEEPLLATSPLWNMENVLISPHCTDRTENPDWLDLTAQVFVENFQRYVRGEALMNVVDKEAGY